LAEEYTASDEQLFVILAAWKKTILSVSLNPAFKGNWFHVSNSSTFWQIENLILQGL
jgi:hypothetical protein